MNFQPSSLLPLRTFPGALYKIGFPRLLPLGRRYHFYVFNSFLESSPKEDVSLSHSWKAANHVPVNNSGSSFPLCHPNNIVVLPWDRESGCSVAAGSLSHAPWAEAADPGTPGFQFCILQPHLRSVTSALSTWASPCLFFLIHFYVSYYNSRFTGCP